MFKYRYGSLLRYNPFLNYSSTICNRSNTYQCRNTSKCISIHRLMDFIYDCPYLDDEDQNNIKNIVLTENYNSSHFKCSMF